MAKVWILAGSFHLSLLMSAVWADEPPVNFGTFTGNAIFVTDNACVETSQTRSPDNHELSILLAHLRVAAPPNGAAGSTSRAMIVSIPVVLTESSTAILDIRGGAVLDENTSCNVAVISAHTTQSVTGARFAELMANETIWRVAISTPRESMQLSFSIVLSCYGEALGMNSIFEIESIDIFWQVP